MTWTTETPAVGGWFWWRPRPDAAAQMTRVIPGADGRVWAQDFSYNRTLLADAMPGEWHGPLVPPQNGGTPP